MRAAVKYFARKGAGKSSASMYQDSDFGKDVLAGVVAQTKAMGMKIAGTTAHRPTDTDFNAPVAKTAKTPAATRSCMGTIVRDTNIIIQTARKMGWNVDFVGQFASYDTAVASLPGGATEGFFCMAPALYAYPDDPRPAVQDFAKRFEAKFGRPPNFHGEVGYTAATVVLMALDHAGRDLTTDSFIKGMEGIHDYKDIFGTAVVRSGSASCLDQLVPDGGQERPLGAGRGNRPQLLIGECQGAACPLVDHPAGNAWPHLS